MKLEPARFLRRGIHLGRNYDYYWLRVKIGIKDAKERRRCMVKACRSVMWWRQPERNPFLLANARRKGFVGREFLAQLREARLLNQLD